MNANRIEKEAVVKEVLQKINDSKSLVVAEYAGLSVKETQELRAALKAKGVELKVYKNRLVKIAAKEAGFEELVTSLTGPNTFAFGMEDDISPAKVLAEFAKEHEALKIKAGTFEGNVIDAAGVQEVATLPTMEEALTKLALALLTPIKDLGIGLNLMVEEGHLEGDATEAAAPAEATEATEATEAPAEVKAEETTEAPAEAAVEETKEEAPAEAAATEETPAE